jgi:hypothetical protein
LIEALFAPNLILLLLEETSQARDSFTPAKVFSIKNNRCNGKAVIFKKKQIVISNHSNRIQTPKSIGFYNNYLANSVR